MQVVPLWLPLVLSGILGVIWGSFVSALCDRWSRGESIATGRSECAGCHRVIAAYDLVPVASFFILRGKCRYCGHRFGTESLAVECTAGAIGILAIVFFPISQGIAVALFGWLLLPLAILDYRHYWLPDRLTFALALVGIVVGPLLTPDIRWIDRAIGAAGGYLFLETVRLAYRRLRKRDGLGAGDPKLFGAIGIWVGWELLPLTMLAATALGLAVASARHLSGNAQKTALPLGTYLAAAAFLLCWLT